MAEEDLAAQVTELRAANEKREERLHAAQLCTHKELPGIQDRIFRDLVLDALGVERAAYELAVEKERERMFGQLEKELNRRMLTQGVSPMAPPGPPRSN